MAYTYHGTTELIELPGRSIATFPSGLVRVDRTYACRTERASAFRQQFAEGTILPFDDGRPAIDGLYIFPEAQETQKENGFTEFKVSAYGRTNTKGQVSSTFMETTAELITTSFFTSQPLTSSTIAFPVVIEVVTTQSTAFNILQISTMFPESIPINVFVRQGGGFLKIEEVYKPGIVYTESGGIFGRIATQTSIEISPVVSQLPGTQFGTFREVIFTFSAAVTVRQKEFPNS